jgi:hypothetical protein
VTVPVGILFTEPKLQPLSVTGKIQPGCTRKFFLTKSTTIAPVYKDGSILQPYAQPIVSNASGVFPPIYLDPTLTYRSQLFSADGRLLEDEDPYCPPTNFSYAVVKRGAEARISTTTPTADSELVIYVPGPGYYEFDALLEFVTPGSSGATPGVAVSAVFTGAFRDGFSASYSIVGSMNATSVQTADSMNRSGAGFAGLTVATYSLAGAGALNTLAYRGSFYATEPGALAIYWAQKTSSTNATFLNAGSFLRLLAASNNSTVNLGSLPVNIPAPNPNLPPAVFIAGQSASYAIGSSTNKYPYSADGVNWSIGTCTPATGGAGGPFLGGAAWSPALGLWAMPDSGGNGVNQAMYTSPDGITWTARTMPNTKAWNAVAWSPRLGLFCAVAGDNSTTTGTVATSPDGVTWTARNSATASVWNGIIWVPFANSGLGIFVAGADVGSALSQSMMYSTDGINWTTVTFTGSFPLPVSNLTYGNNVIVGCVRGNIGVCMTSHDGITWTRTYPPPAQWTGNAIDNIVFVPAPAPPSQRGGLIGGGSGPLGPFGSVGTFVSLNGGAGPGALGTDSVGDPTQNTGWTEILGNVSPAPVTTAGRHYCGVAYSPSLGRVVVFEESNGGVAYLDSFRIITSANGGQGWNAIAIPGGLPALWGGYYVSAAG